MARKQAQVKEGEQVNEWPRSGPIDSISLRGFKSHRNTHDITLKPITLLAGGNSSGKSSLMQPLLLMKQTLETTFEPPPLHLGGPCLTIDSAEEMFWRGDDGERLGFWSVGLHFGEFQVEVTYGHTQSTLGGIKLEKTCLSVDGFDEQILVRDELSHNLLIAEIGKISRMWELASFAESSYSFRLSAIPGRCAHILVLIHLNPVHSPTQNQIIYNFLPYPHTIDSLIHLPGLRDGPERSYDVTGVSGRFPGRFPEYTASLLYHWQQKQDERLQGVVDDLRTLGLADQLQAQKVNDRRVELRVSRRIGGAASDMVNLADVGVGVSQVLPIVVALRAAGKDQIVHIEQPELHLHPRAEIALASLFVAAARRGARLVLETHSSTLLRAFQAAVAEDDTGWVQQNLALHWFARDASGESKVTTAEVQADGSFGDWPVDLNLVEMEMTRRLLNASHARRAKAAKGSS